MDAPARLGSYRRRISDIALRARQAGAALAAVDATATSRDGAVTVTVDPAGALRRLVLHERGEAMSRVQLAAAVLETARRAQAVAAEAAAEAVAPLVGDTSEAMRLLRSYLPESEDGRGQ